MDCESVPALFGVRKGDVEELKGAAGRTRPASIVRRNLILNFVFSFLLIHRYTVKKSKIKMNHPNQTSFTPADFLKLSSNPVFLTLAPKNKIFQEAQ